MEQKEITSEMQDHENSQTNQAFKWSEHFTNAYQDVKNRFPEIYTLKQNELKSVQFTLKKAEGDLALALYVLAIVSCPLIFGILGYTYHLWAVHSVQISHFLRDRVLTQQYSELRRIIVSAVLVIALYCFLPFALRFTNARKFLLSQSRFAYFSNHFIFNIDPSSLIAKTLAVCGAYLLYIPIAEYVAIRFTKLEWIATALLGTWLLIPYTLICFFSVALTLFFLAQKWLNRIRRRAIFYRTLIKVMKIILRLSRSTGSSLTVPRREYLVDQINSISDGLQEIFSPKNKSQEIWVNARLSALGTKFREFTYWLYFPQVDTVSVLQKKLIDFLNVALSGNFHYMDEALAVELVVHPLVKKDGKWRKVLLHASMAAYFVAPLIAFMLAAKHWNIQFLGLIQTFGGLLYLLWVVIGFFSFSDSLSSDSRALLTDIIKSIVGRKT